MNTKPAFFISASALALAASTPWAKESAAQKAQAIFSQTGIHSGFHRASCS